LTAKQQILVNTLAFSDYIALEEKEGISYQCQFRIPGVSTMTLKDELILFTFNNAIYISGHDNMVK
jgi:hypothetical protein